ncbi:hypothetical protein SESBI_47228 [Sesbania bispinosa]|nr:hypothetical protein SESBI_47228 [Sesbania bispinosa]
MLGAAAGVWAYKKHKQKTNVYIMALNLVRGVPLTPKRRKQCLIFLHHLLHRELGLPSGGDGKVNDPIYYLPISFVGLFCRFPLLLVGLIFLCLELYSFGHLCWSFLQDKLSTWLKLPSVDLILFYVMSLN